METMKTATGKTFQCDYFLASETYGQVNIRILNSSFPAVAAIFSAKEETVKLEYAETVLQNHTKLKAMIPEGNAIRVVLERE